MGMLSTIVVAHMLRPIWLTCKCLIQWWSACPFSYVNDFDSFGSLYFWERKKENYDFLFENKGLSHENRGLWSLTIIADYYVKL